ncbi:hypothetical protein [Psychroserpens algicola]|uniref:Uncharacterized protein n=1 Tax=Psychroserpens algicola TaxID=1719034 RepID=A0ABT0H938_9FLAO|nr:hypothetical protein [Psychroserpens algicola]MCK8480884.1 hypothetical protein [Psychroserpens algicola]
MNQMEDLNTVQQLLKTLQDFQVVKCNMHHERVLTDLSNNPMFRKQDDAIIFDRVNLCPMKDRKLRLGCAHSPVNINFERHLKCLAAELPELQDQILNFTSQFKTVVSKIYMLDHNVGHIERDLAMCKLNSDDSKQEKLNRNLEDLKVQHRLFMTRLSEIKSDIEGLIVADLNYSN